MGRLDGRVAIVTGAGRGLGRAYALALAAEGAAVLVNDAGVDADGEGHSATPAEQVVAEILAMGGRAVADATDVSEWHGAEAIVAAAVAAFGGLHVLINNAGVLLHHNILTVTEAEWDCAIAINLKGDMAMTRAAMLYWVGLGEPAQASIVHTSSIGAMAALGNPSYSASKAGVANLGMVAALEGKPHGIRSNVIAPGGRSRLTLAQHGEERMHRHVGDFDFNDPANAAPLIVYLAMANCPLTGAVLHASGNQIGLFRQWPFAGTIEAPGRWTVDALAEALPALCGTTDMPSAATTLPDFIALVEKAKAALPAQSASGSQPR